MNAIHGGDVLHLHFDISDVWDGDSISSSSAWWFGLSCGEWMRNAMTREIAALAVIEQALGKVLLQLALAQSTVRLCGTPLSHELEDLVAHATELRQRIVDAKCLVGAR
jgi:hypothetical protein